MPTTGVLAGRQPKLRDRAAISGDGAGDRQRLPGAERLGDDHDHGQRSERGAELAAIGNRTVNEGSLLTFHGQRHRRRFTGPDSHVQPRCGCSGRRDDQPTTGVFSWTPTESQGPGRLASFA